MDIGLLFRKRHALNDEGLPWLRGDERNTAWCARRNTTGEAGVSAILIRAVQAAAQHHAIVEGRVTTQRGSGADHRALDQQINGQGDRVVSLVGVALGSLSAQRQARSGDLLPRPAGVGRSVCRARRLCRSARRLRSVDHRNQRRRDSRDAQRPAVSRGRRGLLCAQVSRLLGR